MYGKHSNVEKKYTSNIQSTPAFKMQIGLLVKKIIKSDLLSDEEKFEFISFMDLRNSPGLQESFQHKAILEKYDSTIKSIASNLNIKSEETPEKILQKINTEVSDLVKLANKTKEESKLFEKKVASERKKFVLIVNQLEKKIKKNEEKTSEFLKKPSMTDKNESTQKCFIETEEFARILQQKDQQIFNEIQKRKLEKVKFMALVLDIQKSVSMDSDIDLIKHSGIDQTAFKNSSSLSQFKWTVSNSRKELLNLKEFYTALKEGDIGLVENDDKNNFNFNKSKHQSISPEGNRNLKDEFATDRNKINKFQSMETMKYNRHSDVKQKTELQMKDLDQLVNVFQIKIMAKYKKFLNKELKKSSFDLNLFLNSKVSDIPDDFHFFHYHKSKAINSILKEAQKKQPAIGIRESVMSDAFRGSVCIVKEELLRQKIGFYEQQIQLKEKIQKSHELKQIIDCLLAEIDRKEKTIENKNALIRSGLEIEGQKTPSRGESPKLDKTLVILRENIRQKDETIFKLKTQLEKTELESKLSKSDITDTQLRHQTNSLRQSCEKGKNSFTSRKQCFKIQFCYAQTKQHTSCEKKIRAFFDYNLGGQKGYLDQLSMPSSSKKIVLNGQIEGKEVDARFTFGRRQKNLAESRLEFENAILRVNSMSFQSAKTYLHKINSSYFGRIDEVANGIEDAESRTANLQVNVESIKFICEKLRFQGKKSEDSLRKTVKNVVSWQNSVDKNLNNQVAKNKQKLKLLKDKLQKIRLLISEHQKSTNSMKSICRSLEVEMSPNNLHQCLSKIKELKTNSSSMSFIKQHFNLSSNRECEIEELQILKKSEQLRLLIEKKFQIALDSENVDDIIQIFVDDRQKARMLDKITSIIETNVNASDTQSSERFLWMITKIKTIIKHIETEAQNSFQNLSSKDIEDLFIKYKSDRNLKSSDNIDKVKKVIIEVFRPTFMDENNFVPWLTKFCEDLAQKQIEDKKELQAKDAENQQFIDRFIEMKTEIYNLMKQLENKSKHLEQEKQKKLTESSQDNGKTESFKIKIKNLQKNITDLEKKLEVCRSVLVAMGLNPNDKDIRIKFEEKMNEFRKNPALMKFEFKERRRSSNQKNKNLDNIREIDFDETREIGHEVASLYVSEHRTFTTQNNQLREEKKDGSTSEHGTSKSQKKSYFVKSFLNLGGKSKI